MMIGLLDDLSDLRGVQGGGFPPAREAGDFFFMIH